MKNITKTIKLFLITIIFCTLALFDYTLVKADETSNNDGMQIDNSMFSDENCVNPSTFYTVNKRSPYFSLWVSVYVPNIDPNSKSTLSSLTIYLRDNNTGIMYKDSGYIYSKYELEDNNGCVKATIPLCAGDYTYWVAYNNTPDSDQVYTYYVHSQDVTVTEAAASQYKGQSVCCFLSTKEREDEIKPIKYKVLNDNYKPHLEYLLGYVLKNEQEGFVYDSADLYDMSLSDMYNAYKDGTYTPIDDSNFSGITSITPSRAVIQETETINSFYETRTTSNPTTQSMTTDSSETETTVSVIETTKIKETIGSLETTTSTTTDDNENDNNNSIIFITIIIFIAVGIGAGIYFVTKTKK